jgi:S1/P1 Nuclease
MILRKPPRSIFALACIMFQHAAPALAWNPSGHETIALIAYDQLDDATKSRAVALLKAHPRLREHFSFTQQREVGRATDAEQDQWLFAYASTWPDIVREAKQGVTRDDVQQYNRPWWHFADLPVFLNDAERQELAPQITVNLRRDVPNDQDDPKMNVIQAIKNSSRIVSDSTAPAELRSVHLCWLLHLVGDAHQPLHSTALFTRERFPQGDHGGNYLNIEHDYTLHGFWDDQVSTEQPYETIRRLAHDVGQNRELAAAGEQAAASLDPGVWIDEGHQLAIQYVYTPEVLAKVAAREGHSHLGALHPAESYYQNAETASERQAVIAGHRLARLLQQLLP